MAARVPADLAMFAKDKPLPEAVLTGLRQDRRFRHVTSARLAEFANGQISYTAIDIDMKALPTVQTLQAASGDLAALAPGKAILSHGLAEDLHAAVGDTVVLGKVRVEVAAILTGDGPLRANAVLDPATLTELGAAQAVVLADVAGGSRTEALTAFRAAGNPSGAEVAVLADERDKADAEISSLFAAALGLLGLTVLIAVTGVGTTTGLSVLERTRESGLLRALGLSKPRLRLMIGMESGLYGLIGAVLGTALGVPLSWLALEALNLDIPVVFPVGRLLVVAAALTAITVLAGLLPARRAARVSPVAALANGE
jgi:putative ABC transport system permease protein